MIISHDRLEQLVGRIFAAGGCGPSEHNRIAHYLVGANLVGHDSHGVIRAPAYIDWLRAGKVVANQELEIVFENDAIAVVDGRFGFGQVMGEEAMKLGIGDVDDARLGRNIAVITESYELAKPPTLGRVFDRAFLPPAADRKLPR